MGIDTQTLINIFVIVEGAIFIFLVYLIYRSIKEVLEIIYSNHFLIEDQLEDIQQKGIKYLGAIQDVRNEIADLNFLHEMNSLREKEKSKPKPKTDEQKAKLSASMKERWAQKKAQANPPAPDIP